MSAFAAPLISALLTSLNQHRQQLNGKRIWLACSGGRDSLSLAMLCLQLFDEGRLPFLPQLLHVNHGMQESNVAWAKQVKNWADNNHMSCHVLTIHSDIKTEQSARQARYEAMINAMNSDDVLMLGHHMDDQVETVLMRLFNGAGVNGLSGMADFSIKRFMLNKDHADINKCASNKAIHLWRPWLTVNRSQITAYAKASRLLYIDDPTNVVNLTSETNHSKANYSEFGATLKVNDRAWLRSVLMPIVNERYPRAVEAIFRTSQHMRDASHIIDEQIEIELNRLSINPQSIHTLTDMQSVIDINKLHKLSSAMQSAVIHAWLSPTSLELPPAKHLVNDVLRLSQREGNNHQTCLYWDNSLYKYEIRRYQQRLYRLRMDWLNWLDVKPEITEIKVTNHTASTIPGYHELKADKSNFVWRVGHMPKLIEFIFEKKLASDADKNANWALRFELLPRDIKLALAGRVGRKSGKKLLQSINQPAFMRDSVVLCSLVKQRDNVSCYQNKTLVPLFIVAINDIYPIQSEFVDKIIDLRNNHQLVTQVVYSETG